ARLGRDDWQGAAQVRRPHGHRDRCDVLPRWQTHRLRKHRRHCARLGSAALTSFHKEPNMTTWLIRCFAGLLLVLPFVPAVADDPDDKEIARLVKQLGSSVFRTRDAATKRLQEIGEPARAALCNAVTSGADLETQRRASLLLQA